MTMKPILFNTEMVRAIMEGRKTVTRRVIKPQPQSRLAFRCMGHKCGKWGYPSRDAHKHWDDPTYRIPKEMPYEEYQRVWTPPCNTDDILYVRETWAWDCTDDDIGTGCFLYKADGKEYEGLNWRPSIHMPKEAARIFLRVKRVSVERLQDITEDQALSEGIEPVYLGDGEFAYAVVNPDALCSSPKVAFSRLWDSTIKPADREKYGWNANPWVWVIEFERCEKPEE